jgi:hypothetical protein
VTDKQLVANRRNALKSTGPKSPQGKRAIRGNARKLGLFASGDLIFDDEGEKQRLEDFFEELCESDGAQGGMEKLLLEEAAVARFKARKAEKLGQKLLGELQSPLAARMVTKLLATVPQPSGRSMADSGQTPEAQVPFRLEGLHFKLHESSHSTISNKDNYSHRSSDLDFNLADPIDTVHRAERSAKRDMYRAIDRLQELRKRRRQPGKEEGGDG